MILRNSFYNLLGMGLPVGVALVSIPVLIEQLGPERFGILTLIWAVVSYFGLFDLGLGRVLTQQVAVTIAEGDHCRLRAVVATAYVLMFALGSMGGGVLAGAAPWLASRVAASTDVTEVFYAILWMGLAVPFIVLTAGYRGVLEALGRFGLVNALRAPMGVFTFLGPLVVTLAVSSRLDVIASVLCLGRIVACGAHALLALRAVPGTLSLSQIDRTLINPLLRMGGWMSISNVISPLMSFLDRFALGFMVSAVAVAHYTTPQELVLRAGVIPAALATVLFPIFASTAGTHDHLRKAAESRRYAIIMGGLTLPLGVVLLIWPESLLSWWIDPVFAEASAPMLRVMSLALVTSALAQIPFAMLQASGRADLTAKVHLVEFPLYAGVLYALIIWLGPIGAAWAWSIRISTDMVAMYVMNGWQLRGCHPCERKTGEQQTCPVTRESQ